MSDSNDNKKDENPSNLFDLSTVINGEQVHQINNVLGLLIYSTEDLEDIIRSEKFDSELALKELDNIKTSVDRIRLMNESFQFLFTSKNDSFRMSKLFELLKNYFDKISLINGSNNKLIYIIKDDFKIKYTNLPFAILQFFVTLEKELDLKDSEINIKIHTGHISINNLLEENILQLNRSQDILENLIKDIFSLSIQDDSLVLNQIY